MVFRSRRLTAGLAAAVVVALSSLPAPAATLTAFAELVARAERIVVSEVVEVRSELRRTRDGQLPFTLVTLRTIRTLKGTPSVQLLIEVPGGEIVSRANTPQGERLEIIGMPSFTVGDRDVLFLAPPGALSPLVGLRRGRYRVITGAEGVGEIVTNGDGTPLRDESGRAMTLRAFEQQIRQLAAGSSTRPSTEASLKTGSQAAAGVQWSVPSDPRLAEPDVLQETSRPSQDLWPAPLALTIRLGPSPALLNGCPDWPCVVARALEPFGPPSSGSDTLTREASSGASAGEAAEKASLTIAWATEIFGRSIDDFTPALTVRRVVDGQRSVTVLLNQTFAWNAYQGEPRIDDTGRPLFDLERVLEDEFRGVFEAATSSGDPGTTVPPVSRQRSATPPVQPSAASRRLSPQDSGVEGRALAPCDPNSGIMTNPRMLIFQSPDDWAMSGYQVGIFREGASSPERTVDLGREAFLIRRVVDLPADMAATFQQSFVTMIQTSGLATANGVVYTYRVRGVWAAGTTAWSEPSQPFATCPGA